MAQPLELWWSPHRPSYYPRQCYMAGNSMKDAQFKLRKLLNSSLILQGPFKIGPQDYEYF